MKSESANTAVLSLAKTTGNTAIIRHLNKALKNFHGQEYKAKDLDFFLVERLKILLRHRFNQYFKIHSSQIYRQLCSRQNWYYRILKSPARLVWILTQVYTELKVELSKDLNLTVVIPAELYFKNGRLNYSEGLRRVRFAELCAFLNFTTKRLSLG